LVSAEQVWKALQQVADPEYPLSIVDLGMVYAVSVKEDQVQIRMTFTSIGCPAIDWIISDMREAVMAIKGVSKVDVDVVWSPAWTRERITQHGREVLLYHGVT